jgi:putative ABC transport system permease protein
MGAEEVGVLAITLADLRHRYRQFLIAVIGAGLVFALALLLTGMVSGFRNEVDRTVDSAQADGWVVNEGVSGPFTSVAAIDESVVSELAGTPGVTAANGLVISLQTVDRGSAALERAMVIGTPEDGPGPVAPPVGEPVRGDDEAVVDRRLDLGLGDRFTLGTRAFTVVGLMEGMTMLGGTADVWISLTAAQDALFQGQPLVTAIVVQGSPDKLPAGMVLMSNGEVEEDSLGPMADAVSSVDNSRYLMWVVAAIIVAALIYVSALQRLRDFAVLKAVGASSMSLFVGVALQAVLITLAAAGLAAASAGLLKPLYLVPVEVPSGAYLVLPLLAVGIGVLSSLVALRQALKVDPALAFGGG